MIRAARLWSVHHARCQCRDVDLQQCDIAQPNTARYDHYNHSRCTYIDDMIANADDHNIASTQTECYMQLQI